MSDINDFIRKKVKERDIDEANVRMEVRMSADKDIKSKISASVTLCRDYVKYPSDHKYINHVLYTAKHNGWFVVPSCNKNGIVVSYTIYFNNAKEVRKECMKEDVNDFFDDMSISGAMCSVVFLLAFIVSKLI